ncbi:MULTISPECIES: LPS export ABC transporter periplasmic protein LptC [Flavobacterium]|nr:MULTISPECIES: LPS export ABC transporter periplasmic protein LptC [Flavobacterium]MCJ1806742.1 LPS export ABC transporter periplasmic protein LptC [Flavobacterium covae]MCJ1808321.1 LPS export ABC transporter periplasmic protein LptC [Flavobacterium covae]
MASLFFMSCENSIKEVRKIGVTSINPIGEIEKFNLKYTDSGKIKAVLISPKMVDYTTAEFPFNEFPDGLNLEVYDEKGNKSLVTSKYAIIYSKTDLIELNKNVIITTHDGKRLETEQLYYDQKNEWFFTQKPFKFTNNGSAINGVGIDFSKDFSFLDTQNIQGTYSL